MLEKFKSFIEEHNLCRASEKVLLAVSGGIDSAIMLDLFHSSGMKVGVAHCNFRLRGEESDEDEEFVRKLAGKHELDFHIRAFETTKIAHAEGISIQMAARDLRYAWFEEVRAKQGYDWIATAHNQDDILETFFINLSRGTGIRGLAGIPLRAGKVIRPLLFASRQEIQAHAKEKYLDYREDSSNASEKYLRNKIRHQLIPMMEEQNPSFRSSLVDTIERLKDTAAVFKKEIERMQGLVTRRSDNKVSIHIKELMNQAPLKTLLFEILTEFNFSAPVMEDILNALESPPGKQFFSSSHRLVKDREELIITAIEETDRRKYYLELHEGQIKTPVQLDWMVVEQTVSFRIPDDPHVACLDFELLDFPLILRHWQQGDYFQPLGMQGMKKLSDFLIDEKISLPEKEKIWLLCTGRRILWVVGYRIDERFKITPGTKQILMIRSGKKGPSAL